MMVWWLTPFGRYFVRMRRENAKRLMQWHTEKKYVTRTFFGDSIDVYSFIEVHIVNLLCISLALFLQ